MRNNGTLAKGKKLTQGSTFKKRDGSLTNYSCIACLICTQRRVCNSHLTRVSLLGLSLGFEDEKKNGEFSCINSIFSYIPSFLSDPLNSGRALAVIMRKSQTNSEFFPETLTRPYLSALPSPVVERGGNVILRCQGHCQNVTFMLGKLQDSGYRQEQRSAGHAAEFFLTYLEPEDSGTYFCAYKAMDSQEWSEKSEHLQLEVTGEKGSFRSVLEAHIPCPLMEPAWGKKNPGNKDRCDWLSVENWGW